MHGMLCHDGAEVSASGLKIGRSPLFKSHPRLSILNFGQVILQLNQLGSKAASAFNLKTVDYLQGMSQITCTLLTLLSIQGHGCMGSMHDREASRGHGRMEDVHEGHPWA